MKANARPFQRCTQCVMDTSDSKIIFDDEGICDHCRNFEKNIRIKGEKYRELSSNKK